MPFPTPTPEPDPGLTTHPLSVHLFVSEPSGGTVTDTSAPTGQINCGAAGDDCGHGYTALVTCDSDDDCTSSGPPETLVASGFPLPGYTARFFACTSNATGTTACTAGVACDDGAGGCRLEMNQNWRVRVEWSDTTAPTRPSISGPAKAGPAVHHFAGGGATDNTAVTSYRYFLDDVDQGISDSGFDVDVASLRAGTHHVSARARDPAGNQSEVSDAFAFTVDRSAALSITSPAAGGHFKAAPTFSFSHDADAGEVVCQTLDAGSAVIHESACSGSYAPQTGADGDYSARVIFTDDVGQPGHRHARVQARHGRSECRDHGADCGPARAVALHAGVHSDGRRHGRRQPAEGVQARERRRLRSVRRARRDRRLAHALGPRDGRGGQRACGDRRVRRRFDRSAGRIASGPPDDAIVTTPSATYGWTASDPTPPLQQPCKLDGAAAAPCGSPETLSGLSEGSHTFTLTVTDALGNATVVKRDVFVNAVRPSVPITSGPADGAVLKTKSATFGFNAAGGCTVSCSLDSETAFRPCSGPRSDALAGLADGAHTFRVRVRDVSDDVAVASRAFAVDSSLPSVKQIVRRIVNASVTYNYLAFRRYTILRPLMLKRVPAGATIFVRCRGNGVRCDRCASMGAAPSSS